MDIRTSGDSLIDLGPDILLMIIDLLPIADIRSIRLVCSSFANSARDGLYRDFVMRNHKDGFDLAQERLLTLQKDGLLPAVRRFEVRGLYDGVLVRPNRRANGDQYTRLASKCLLQMPGLKDFRFIGPHIPPEITAALANLPGLRLWVVATGMIEHAQLCTLKHNQQLHSLQVCHKFVTAYQCLLVTKPLREVLLTCPNLKKLKLDIGTLRGECMGTPIPTLYHGIGFRNGEKPPALEELEMFEYPFGYTSDRELHSFEQYPETIDEDVYWAEMFDWSRLRKLHAPGSPLAIKLLNISSALEELKLAGMDWGPPVTFSEERPVPLKSIEIDGIKSIGWEGIAKYGASLQRLTVHHNEWSGGAWNKRMIGDGTVHRDGKVQDDYLLKVQQHCPHIQELAIDIGRNGDWSYATLDILACYPRLRTLELWFEVGIKDNENPVKPYVTFTATARLFRYLLAQNRHIQQLTVHSGTPSGLGDNHKSQKLRDDCKWLDQNSATFECQRAAMYEDARQGIFQITCTKLDKGENDMLRRMLARYPSGDVSVNEAMEGIGEDWRAVEVKRMHSCKVAWEGPAPFVPIDINAAIAAIAEAASLPLPESDEFDE